MRQEVKDRLFETLSLAGNPGSIHTEGRGARNVLESAREEAALAIRALPREIVFLSGGTEANNLALFGSVRVLPRGPFHIITTAVEHSSVLECVRALEREGCTATYLPVDEEGRISLKQLREAMTEQTLLVSIQYVNSETGVIQDVREIAKTIRHARKERKGGLPLLFHTDASQAPLYLSCDTPKLGVDMMTLDAQKMGGPKGVGILYVKSGTQLAPLILGGGQEKGLRSGTENVPFAAACARALSLAQKEYETTEKRVGAWRDALWTEIKRVIPEAEMNGSYEKRIANVLNIHIPALDAELAVVGLDAKGIAASARSACDMKEGGASYVIEAMGYGRGRAQESVRFSLLAYEKPPAARVAEALVATRALAHRQKLT